MSESEDGISLAAGGEVETPLGYQDDQTAGLRTADDGKGEEASTAKYLAKLLLKKTRAKGAFTSARRQLLVQLALEGPRQFHMESQCAELEDRMAAVVGVLMELIELFAEGNHADDVKMLAKFFCNV